jgi:heme-degrading monooxygenase HmoA
MYMRITWGKVRPGLWETFETTYKRVADPAIAGLCARWLVRDTVDPDAIFAITLWESREAIDRWEAAPEYRTRFLDEIDPLMLGAYSVSICEVLYDSIQPETLLRAREAKSRP